MKSLKINSDCQKALDNFSSKAKGPFSAGVLVGQLENQTYLLIDVLPIDFSVFETTQTFNEYLNKPNDQQETPFARFLNMTSNAKMMLGGGLSIIGVVFSVEFQNFENNSDAFKSLVDTIKDVGTEKTETIIIVQNKIKKKNDYLLYEYNARKFSVIDYQYQSFKDRIFKLSTSIEAEIMIPITKGESGSLKVMHISDKLKTSLRRWTTDLSNGFVKIGGKFIDKAEVLENIKTKLQLKDNSFNLEIYSPSPIQKAYASFEEETGTVITFQGIFTAFSYVLTKKTTLKDAYQVLINDLLQSVQNKLNLFASEHEEILQNQLAQNRIFFLPNRVYSDFPENGAGKLTYCDYLTSEETLQESEQRLKEWFDLTPKYSDSVEFSTAQDFQDKYLKFQDRNKIQQKEGVTQRKTEEVPTSKQVNDKEKVPVQSENLKENNLVKYGAIVGVVILLLLIRFLVL